MGADCHPNIEVLGEDGKWKHFLRIWYDEPNPVLRAFKERDYRLFGILAGVRGGREPLFAGRGLPNDASPEVKSRFEGNVDYHSVTWFTVQELLDVSWDAPIGKRPIELDPSSYLAWVEGGRQGDPGNLVIDGKDILVSEEEMVLLLTSGLRTRRTGKTRPGDLHKLKPLQYVEVESTVTLRDEVPFFVNQIIPELVKIGDPSRVRVVIGFDS